MGRPFDVLFIQVMAFSLPSIYSRPFSFTSILGCFSVRINSTIS